MNNSQLGFSIELEKRMDIVDTDMNNLLLQLSDTLFDFSQNLKMFDNESFNFRYILDQFCSKNHEIMALTNLLIRLKANETQFKTHLNKIIVELKDTVIKLFQFLKQQEIFIPVEDLTSSQIIEFYQRPEEAKAYFEFPLQLYLPSEKFLSRKYIKSLLAGNKNFRIFKKSYVNQIDVPYYDEFSITKHYKQNENDELLNSFIPLGYEITKLPSREYYFNIFNTLYPGKLEQQIYECYENRYENQQAKLKSQNRYEITEFNFKLMLRIWRQNMRVQKRKILIRKINQTIKRGQ